MIYKSIAKKSTQFLKIQNILLLLLSIFSFSHIQGADESKEEEKEKKDQEKQELFTKLEKLKKIGKFLNAVVELDEEKKIKGPDSIPDEVVAAYISMNFSPSKNKNDADSKDNIKKVKEDMENKQKEIEEKDGEIDHLDTKISEVNEKLKNTKSDDSLKNQKDKLLKDRDKLVKDRDKLVKDHANLLKRYRVKQIKGWLKGAKPVTYDNIKMEVLNQQQREERDEIAQELYDKIEKVQEKNEEELAKLEKMRDIAKDNFVFAGKSFGSPLVKEEEKNTQINNIDEKLLSKYIKAYKNYLDKKKKKSRQEKKDLKKLNAFFGKKSYKKLKSSGQPYKNFVEPLLEEVDPLRKKKQYEMNDIVVKFVNDDLSLQKKLNSVIYHAIVPYNRAKHVKEAKDDEIAMTLGILYESLKYLSDIIEKKGGSNSNLINDLQKAAGGNIGSKSDYKTSDGKKIFDKISNQNKIIKEYKKEVADIVKPSNQRGNKVDYDKEGVTGMRAIYNKIDELEKAAVSSGNNNNDATTQYKTLAGYLVENANNTLTNEKVIALEAIPEFNNVKTAIDTLKSQLALKNNEPDNPQMKKLQEMLSSRKNEISTITSNLTIVNEKLTQETKAKNDLQTKLNKAKSDLQKAQTTNNNNNGGTLFNTNDHVLKADFSKVEKEKSNLQKKLNTANTKLNQANTKLNKVTNEINTLKDKKGNKGEEGNKKIVFYSLIGVSALLVIQTTFLAIYLALGGKKSLIDWTKGLLTDSNESEDE